MPTLLSLKHNQTAQTGWHERDAGCYDAEYANAIEEPAGIEPHKMLSAIPSPFARLHVFDLAFGFLSEPQRSPVGDTAFHRVVSQCLDALELLFHWNSHVKSGFKLQIVRWDVTGSLGILKEPTARPEHRMLSDALELYFNQDRALAAARTSTWMLVANEGNRRSVLAISSPLTLVAPAPNATQVVERLQLKVPGEGRLYFSDVKALVERSTAFRAYLEHLFGSHHLMDHCPHLFKYLERVKKDSTDFRELALYAQAEYTELEEGGSPIAMHGEVMVCAKAEPVPPNILSSRRRLKADRHGIAQPPIVLIDGVDSVGVARAAFRAPLSDPTPIAERALPDFKSPYPYVIAADFFESVIIKLPHGLNTEAFVLPKECVKQESAFLPPLKPEYFRYFSAHLLPSRLSYELVSGPGVKCSLQVPLVDRSVTLTRFYYPNPQMAGAGQIVEADFSIAAFPSVRWNRDDRDRGAKYVDEQAVALVEMKKLVGPDPTWRSELRFYQVSDDGAFAAPPEGTVFSRERTTKSDAAAFSTKYYRLPWSPDLIEVAIETADGETARSLLAVAAKPPSGGSKEFIVAIDFGTTTSYVALAEKPKANALTKPVQLSPRSDTGEPSIVTLHASTGVNRGRRPAMRGTTSLVAATAEQAFMHEFVPPAVGDLAWLPTRTALAERADGACEDLWGDANIAFFMYRDRVLPNESIQTNLKWARKTDRDIVKRIRLFLREILLLVRSQILLQGGNPTKTTLLWFWPLSFTEYLQSTLDLLWQEEAARVLDIKGDAILSMTESAAPYYYYEASAQTVTTKPVLSIDIGGGSTDIVFFVDKTPKFGTSFNFAGNGLWGDGFNLVGERGAGRNGVANLAAAVLERANEAARSNAQRLTLLDEIAGGLVDHAVLGRSSQEIVNVAFAADEYIGFSEELRNNSTVKLMVLLHYTAIVYHCAQLMRALKLEKPQNLSLSGNGSSSLNVVDVSPRKRFLAAHTATVFKLVYDDWDKIIAVNVTDAGATVAEMRRVLGKVEPADGITLLIADGLKEATCRGGIYWYTVGGAERPEPKSYVLLGGEGSLHPRDDVPRYADIRDAEIDAAAQDFKRFVALFRILASSNKFDLPENIVDDAMPLLWDGVEAAISKGLERRKLNAEGPEERAVETFFFYPLVHKIWQLSHDLKA